MSKHYFTSLIAAVMAPWLLLVGFFRSHSWHERRWILTLFFAVMGSVVLLWSSDGADHIRDVETVYRNMGMDQFLHDLWRVLTFQLTESRTKDVYKHVVSYFFGNVIGMPSLFFPFVAAVYGYFFAGAVMCVLRNLRLSEVNYVILAFVFIFLFIRGLDSFQTVRTWTGMWILVYACLRFYESRRHRYLLMMFLPPLVHIGFFVLAIPAWSVLLLGNRPTLYVVILALSSITTVLPVEDATTILSQTERGASQVSAYRVEEQKVAIEEFERAVGQTNWYNAYRTAGLQRWAPLVLVFTLAGAGIYVRRMKEYHKYIFSIGVLTLAFSNSTWFLYAVHNRSLIIAMIFIVAGYLMARLDPESRSYFKDMPPFYKWGLHLSILLFAPFILFNISMTLGKMSVFMFGFPFVVWIEPEINLSIKQFLLLLVG